MANKLRTPEALAVLLAVLRADTEALRVVLLVVLLVVLMVVPRAVPRAAHKVHTEAPAVQAPVPHLPLAMPARTSVCWTTAFVRRICSPSTLPVLPLSTRSPIVLRSRSRLSLSNGASIAKSPPILSSLLYTMSSSTSTIVDPWLSKRTASVSMT